MKDCDFNCHFNVGDKDSCQCKEQENEEPDFEDEDENTEPDYYYCGCGYNCASRPTFGGQCPKCTAIMEEGYF